MHKYILFTITQLISFITLTSLLKAEFYYTIKGGVSSVEDIKMDVNNNDLSFTGDPVVAIEQEDSVTGFPIMRTRTTETSSYLVNIKDLIFSSKNKYNFTISSAIGYSFDNNLRIESEYRFINFKTDMTDGLVNIDAYIDVFVEVIGLNEEDGQWVEGPVLFTDETNKELLGMPFALAELINGGASDFVPSENGKSPIPIVSFRQNAHLQFFNLIYDAPITDELMFFGGVGVGFGFLAFYTLNVPEDADININPWDSKYFAYQYKLGASYNIYEDIDFIISYSNINGVGETDIGSFTYKHLHFQALDFGFRYTFD